MQECLNIDRKNRFLPKGIYLHENGKYRQYRAAIKVYGKTVTVRYSYNLYEACEALVLAHETFYGKKPHWYKEFKAFYKKHPEPLSF